MIFFFISNGRVTVASQRSNFNGQNDVNVRGENGAGWRMADGAHMGVVFTWLWRRHSLWRMLSRGYTPWPYGVIWSMQ